MIKRWSSKWDSKHPPIFWASDTNCKLVFSTKTLALVRMEATVMLLQPHIPFRSGFPTYPTCQTVTPSWLPKMAWAGWSGGVGSNTASTSIQNGDLHFASQFSLFTRVILFLSEMTSLSGYITEYKCYYRKIFGIWLNGLFWSCISVKIMIFIPKGSTNLFSWVGMNLHLLSAKCGIEWTFCNVYSICHKCKML